MINWQEKVHKPFLICSHSDEKIHPGDTFYSSLLFENDEFVRRDFCENAWNELDQSHYLSWWKQDLPKINNEKKQQLLNATVLLGIFNDLKQSSSRHEQCFLYCLSLLLMRLKKLRYLDLKDEDGEIYVILQDRSDKKLYKIKDPKLTSQEEELVSKNIENIFTIHNNENTNENSSETTDAKMDDKESSLVVEVASTDINTSTSE